jgi:hypothetical protein
MHLPIAPLVQVSSKPPRPSGTGKPKLRPLASGPQRSPARPLLSVTAKWCSSTGPPTARGSSSTLVIVISISRPADPIFKVAPVRSALLNVRPSAVVSTNSVPSALSED